MGNFGGEDKQAGQHGDNSFSLLIWSEDITMEKLNNMTVNQIRELKRAIDGSEPVKGARKQPVSYGKGKRRAVKI